MWFNLASIDQINIFQDDLSILYVNYTARTVNLNSWQSEKDRAQKQRMEGRVNERRTDENKEGEDGRTAERK